jgi:FMN phosphatase YigB (HAD superfamily)
MSWEGLIKMERTKLGERALRVFNSAETGYEKPHPEAYRRPLSYLELVALSFFAEDATIHEVLYAVL